MNRDEARTIVQTAIADIAPDVAFEALDPSEPFADEADFDSMDLLSLAEAIHEATGVDIGAGDLPPRWTLDALLDAVSGRA